MGIVGGVVAVILVLVIVAVVLVLYFRSKQSQKGREKSILMKVDISHGVFYGALYN